MKYERLTSRNDFQGQCSHCRYIPALAEFGCRNDTEKRFMLCNKCENKERYDKLKELEDKIENGTLVELPCKVGDTVYEIDYNREACYECQYYSTFFGIDTECEKDFDIYPDLNTSKIVCDKHFLEVNAIRFSLAFYERNMRSFNKTWFLTKQAAEEKLRELRGEKD